MKARARSATTDPGELTPKLDSWLRETPGARVIATYAALPGEADLLALVARHRERRWVFPRIEGERLVFHEITNPARQLVTGAFGILEPAGGSPAVEIAEIDVFFCPGLAFDARGGRLGRGRGFYDRVLAAARPDARRIGVCFAWQLVADTHAEVHDIRMDHVITD